MGRIRAVAAQINLRGWCEANAGNISVNVSPELNSIIGDTAQWFIVSRTGSRYRDLAVDPLCNLVLISIQNGLEHIHPQGGKPTSEWLCHLSLQQHFLSENRDDRVVLHSHPASVIVLGGLELYQNEGLLNQALDDALPELHLYLPQGVATTPTSPPGSKELAECSLRAIGSRKVLVWQGHGIVSTGLDPDEALDFMEVAEKAAQVLLRKFSLTK
ncbi:MAG: class II aldolase/adducin family protein [Candidatus Syntrophosphaera sp.]|nr:class II aldolase/adducin family protein [Candidatus Syntrophosphaera sp.]